MNYKDRYNKLVEAIKVLQETNLNDEGIQNWVHDNVPELVESEDEDERIRKEIIAYCRNTRCVTEEGAERMSKWIAWLEKQREPEDKGEISDGYHTFNELYRYRMLYNAAFFNLLPKHMVHKSKRHHDGEECFGGGWFIVMANLPTGQISNHYELKDWDLFQVPEKYTADEWDGHTPQEAADRLHRYLLEKQSEQKITDVSFKAKNWYVSKVDGKIYNATYVENIDEKIKKGLIEFFKYLKSIDIEVLTGITNDAMIAWLEKQCENKSTDVEQKFHEGDNAVSFQMYGKVYTVGPTHYVTGGDNICLYDTDRNYKWTNRDDLAKNYHLWTIQDAQKGDVLEFEDHERVIVGVVSFVNKRTGKVDVSCLLEDNKFKIGNFYDLDTINPHPATKEQHDTLMKAMTDAGYIFDFEKKELKMIE